MSTTTETARTAETADRQRRRQPAAALGIRAAAPQGQGRRSREGRARLDDPRLGR